MTDTTLTIPRRLHRRRRVRARSGLVIGLLATIPAIMVIGWSLVGTIDLSEPDTWFLDTKLTSLKTSPGRCMAALASSIIDAAPVPDRPFENGCGWRGGVRIRSIAGAKMSVVVVTCDVAAALAMWIAHDVQAAAVSTFGKRVISIQHLGTYSCRNVVGTKMWSGFRSQHATAGAIDISGFKLEGGETISVKRHWSGSGREAKFLRDVRDSACRYFRVAIGPDFNKAHHDHFHVDRGFLSTCR